MVVGGLVARPFGVSSGVAAGLLSVALCQRGRSVYALTKHAASPCRMYPAFAKAIYAKPIEATGKIVCANCHLSVQPCRLSVPQAAFVNGIVEASIYMPTRRTNAQVAASGAVGAMNVGVVLCLPEAVSVIRQGDVQWERWRPDTHAVVAGPMPAAANSTIPVSFQPLNEAKPGSVNLYLGTNRGRGQAYPNGAASNLVSCRWDALGVVPGRCLLAKRLGVSCWTRAFSWRLHLQLVGVGHAIRPAAGLRGICEEGGVLDVVVNVGGFGQTEEQLVILSDQRLFAGFAFILLGTGNQLALVLKKRQYERWKM